MSRIQRARALRLGFILAAMLSASVASAAPSKATVARCEAKAALDYAIAERVVTDKGGPEDQDRMPGDAARVGAPDPDAAWEDSFAACIQSK